MEYLPEYELYIAGKGGEKENLQRIAKESSLRVKFLDFMPLKRLEKYYLTCFCVVYIPINEDFGMVPIEAQSYGKMVIGAKEGGLLETIIDGKTGFLIENPTPEKIAEKVREMEKMDLKKHANFCMENAKRFDWEVFHMKFAELMSELDKKRNHSVKPRKV